MNDIYWALLFDAHTSKNIAGILYDHESESIRCVSGREELVEAIESMPTQHSEIKATKVGSMVGFSEQRVSDPKEILNRLIRPYLNPLQIGSRGVLRQSTMDSAVDFIKPYAQGAVFSE